jgi:3-methyl-2-oxobutanoate hydroxymethyltransferase
MLALNVDFHPRFVRHYSKLAAEINKAVGNYISDVKKGSFPSAKESY